MSRQPKIKRRQFLAGAAAAGPAIGLAAAKVAAQPVVDSRTSSVPPIPQDENITPPNTPITYGKSGSDYMVDVLKSLDIPYMTTLPASTLRGLHESIVNYGENKMPELLTCLHEDSAVAMAHGYAKVARKPMAAMVHGTVGLQHACMAIYNAYADRVPIVVLSGILEDATTREPHVEWDHSALDQGALVRDFTKWDAQPTSWQATGDALVRAYDLATSVPMAPVFLTLDCNLQENPLPKGENAKLRIPNLLERSQPQGDVNAVREAAKMLVAAENPVIYVNRYGRTEGGPALLVELAELLNAPVVDDHARMNFPNLHKFNFSQQREKILERADVILALEPIGLWHLTNKVVDLVYRPTRPLPRQKDLKIIHIGTDALLIKSNYQDFQRYGAADLSIPGDAEATMPTLLDAVRAEITPVRKSQLATRGQKLAQTSAKFMDEARAAAVYAWDASPISSARLYMELWAQIKDDDWMMPTETQFLSDWPYRLWNIDKPYQVMGGSGGQGIGYNSPAAIGAALANKPHGRLTVAVVGDGDLNMAPGVIWTAAHHQIPLLMMVHNNRAYHQEVMLVTNMAARRNHNVSRADIGTTIQNPNVDYASIAKGYGVYAEGPISDPKELGPAIRRALAVVRKGEPAFLDIVSQPR